MPYRIRKYKNGYRVVSENTGRPLSKRPLSYDTARAQQIAVMIREGLIEIRPSRRKTRSRSRRRHTSQNKRRRSRSLRR